MSPLDEVTQRRIRAAWDAACAAMVEVVESWARDAEKVVARTTSSEVGSEYRQRSSLLRKIIGEMLRTRDRGP